jgi:uncharacterized RmlC-like cupin family protein
VSSPYLRWYILGIKISKTKKVLYYISSTGFQSIRQGNDYDNNAVLAARDLADPAIPKANQNTAHSSVVHTCRVVKATSNNKQSVVLLLNVELRFSLI